MAETGNPGQWGSKFPLESRIPVSYTHLDVYKRQPTGFVAAFMMAGAILLSAPDPAWAARDEVGPGIDLEKQLQEQQEAEQQAESQQTAEQQPEGRQTAEQQPESQQSQEQASNQPEGGADVPEIKAVYQAFMAGSGWSEEYGDNFECLKAGDYMTAVKASLRGQPEGMSGTLTYQVNVSGLGWQPWSENMAEAGGTQAGVVLESVKMDLTGDLKEHYDVYYMVYQNGVDVYKRQGRGLGGSCDSGGAETG